MSKSDFNDFKYNVECVIYDELKFKTKLGIGENAYTSLRLKNAVGELWDAVGAAATGAGVAGSTTVATTFFAHNAVFAALGLASTPVGWIVAAGVLSGGAYLGIARQSKKFAKDRVTVIPEFINTPLDIIGLAIFDLLTPLALKVAHMDGILHEKELSLIKNYFVNNWGYDTEFVEMGVDYLNDNIASYSLKETAKTLAEYKKQNPDCDYDSMSEEILKFLRDIVEVDGKIDERESMALESVSSIFKETGKINILKEINSGLNTISEKFGSILKK